MPQTTFTRSPSQQPRQSRKVYDYLLQQPGSTQKYSNRGSLIPQRQSIIPQRKSIIPQRGFAIGLQHSPHQKQQKEYQLIVQFELRRQKQKTIMLEQRLRNKQSFIKQMRQFQDQLTLEFEKCQQQLQYYKIHSQQYQIKYQQNQVKCQQYESKIQDYFTKIQQYQIKLQDYQNKCQQYQNKFNSFATFNNGTINNINQNSIQNNNLYGQQHLVRQYLQQIAQLKHLVIRLQEEINYYQKKQQINSHHKYNSSSPNQLYPLKQVSKFNSKDSKRHKHHNKNKNAHDSRKDSQPSPTKRKPQKPIIQQNKKNQRSKTLANQFVQQKRNQNFNTYTKISDFIQQQSRKISSFISHFLTMCQFFQQSIQKQTSIKHKLKKAWKWVKTAIVQWNYLKTQKLQKVKQYKIGNIVSKLLPISHLSMSQIQTILQRKLKSPDQKLSKRP